MEAEGIFAEAFRMVWIELSEDLEMMSRGDASRLIDTILKQYSKRKEKK